MRNRRESLVFRIVPVTAASGLTLAFALAAQAGPQNAYVDQPKFSDAAATPLRDIGIMHRKVDPSLQQAKAAPYSIDQVKECSDAKAEITQLDAVLGPDIDAGATNTRTKSQMVKAFAADAVSGVVKIPFRSVVRIVSGADRRDRERQDAIMAGMARRAFLKGVVVGRCQGDGIPYLQVAKAEPKADTPVPATAPAPAAVQVASADPVQTQLDEPAHTRLAANDATPPVQTEQNTRYRWVETGPDGQPRDYARPYDQQPAWVRERATYSSAAAHDEDDGYGQVMAADYRPGRR